MKVFQSSCNFDIVLLKHDAFLSNLGSSLDQDPMYREETSGMICTQYAEASC